MTGLTEVVREFYKDDNALFATLAQDVEWHETEGLSYGGVYLGIEALMKGVFSHSKGDWQNFSADAESIVAVGEDQVLSIGRYSGVFKKTGKRMNASFAHLYTFRGGKVVKFQQFGDSATFNAAMS